MEHQQFFKVNGGVLSSIETELNSDENLQKFYCMDTIIKKWSISARLHLLIKKALGDVGFQVELPQRHPTDKYKHTFNSSGLNYKTKFDEIGEKVESMRSFLETTTNEVVKRITESVDGVTTNISLFVEGTVDQEAKILTFKVMWY